MTGSEAQLELPGIPAKKLAYDGLLKENPQPDNLEQAEAFLRKYCITTITMKRDHDYVRVVLKETNESENKEKHEYSLELSTSLTKKERDEKFIGMAVKAYYAWIDLVGPKYQSK